MQRVSLLHRTRCIQHGQLSPVHLAKPGAQNFYSTCADITSIRGFRQGRVSAGHCSMASSEYQRPQSGIARIARVLCAIDPASLEPGCSGGLSGAAPLGSVGSLGFQLPGVFGVARHVPSAPKCVARLWAQPLKPHATKMFISRRTIIKAATLRFRAAEPDFPYSLALDRDWICISIGHDIIQLGTRRNTFGMPRSTPQTEEHGLVEPALELSLFRVRRSGLPIPGALWTAWARGKGTKGSRPRSGASACSRDQDGALKLCMVA